jgi:hypothetical protein
MLKSKIVSLLAGALLLGTSALLAQVQLIVVTPADAQGWFVKRADTGTVGLGIVDKKGGTSSLLLSTDGSAGQIIRAARIPTPLMRIDEITSLSFDAYSDSAVNYAYPQLEYFNLTYAGTLVYDATNIALATNTWTSVVVDLNVDKFWSTDYGQGDLRTLAQWQTEPTVGPVLMNYFQMGYGSTGAETTQATAYMDFVELNGTTWDFQDVAALPPEPAPVQRSVPTLSQWGMITLFALLGLVAFTRRKHFV